MSKATIDKTNTAEKPVAGRAQTAIISAPAYVDTSGVRKELENRGVTVFSPDELDLPGRNLSEIVREAIGRADFVVAVVDSSAASSNVWFEVGFAQALQKPTFVLLTGDASSAPWLLRAIPYFRFDPDKPTGLDFGISQILTAAQLGAQTPSTPVQRTHPLGDRAIDLLHQLHEAGDTISQEQFETIIASAIRESGVSSVSRASGTDRGIDLAVWSDDLSAWVGNPVAVELRRKLRNATDVSLAVRQLAQAIARSDIPWGLLIYLTATIELVSTAWIPNVLVISAAQFLEGLRETSFSDLIHRLRHQQVHGNF